MKKMDDEILDKLLNLIMEETFKQMWKNIFDPTWEGWCTICDGLHHTENHKDEKETQETPQD